MTDVEAKTTPDTGPRTGSPVYAKYGEAVAAGFQAVPNVLLKNQDSLGLTPTNLVVLLNVLMHWWYPEQMPFPRSTTIAQRMGLSPRAVQRALQQLQKLELLTRERPENGHAYLNPEPLVAKLKKLARNDINYQIRQLKREHEGRENREGESGPHRLPQGHRGSDPPF